MSIGIRLLCSGESAKASFADAVLLLASRGVTADAEYDVNEYRVFLDSDAKIIAVSVGSADDVDDLFSAIRLEFQKLSARNHRAFAAALNSAVHAFRVESFSANVLPGYAALSPGVPLNQQQSLLDAWENHDFGVHAIVGVLDDRGKGFLYLIARPRSGGVWVHKVGHSGVTAIGHGSHEATFWLGYRRQHSARLLEESAYHAFEALQIATQKPGCRANVEVVLAIGDRTFHLTPEVPEAADCPISLSRLATMFGEYGPRQLTAANDIER